MNFTQLLYKIPCHRRADRSLFFKGKQFPLCARCTAIYASYILLPIFAFIHKNIYFLILGILFQLPMFIDGYTQLLKWRESNNTLRMITGFISGFGQCLFIWFWTDFITTHLKL
ncbi:DUF2085 domain-containing protein [Shimazuella sp. AN120528]|uniref:DUF2085 domain-containing protein n=1 Tax=Shimazuella soli TaxID=1892854 RepID=UPI001F10BF9A|nr:DUF2085 domain-containing protein [Shimazuella soli]MCH5586537.1 DUF2085 domain-containing protein [Shimazuella soli]